MSDDRSEARRILEEHLARGGFVEDEPLPTSTEALLALAAAASAEPHRRLDAALVLALRGDARAIATCRLVFTESGFAITNSMNELAYASLALALLGDVEFLPRIRRSIAINLNRQAQPIAVRLLSGAS